MRKVLFIGVIVCVLVLGSIGAAFATELNFDSVGTIASGYASLPDVNVTYFNPGIDNWSNCQAEPMVDRLWLHFDTALNAGTYIRVCAYNSSWICIGSCEIGPTGDIPAGANVQADFTSPVPVEDIYHVGVVVSGP